MAIPLRIAGASWDNYENIFLAQLAALHGEGLCDGVFGDIDLEPHREWVERVCAARRITAHLPLWQRERRELLDTFIGAGYRAMIIVVDRKRLDESFLGRTLDRQTVADLEAAGVDACGEEGEYHTVVYDGPLFTCPLNLGRVSIHREDNYSFLEVMLHENCLTGEAQR